MIYEFKSKATGNLIMTESVGAMVLEAMGKQATSQGVITVEEVAQRLKSLQDAIVRAKTADTASAGSSPTSKNEDAPAPIGLASRALPMVEMLQRALASGKEITWGT